MEPEGTKKTSLTPTALIVAFLVLVGVAAFILLVTPVQEVTVVHTIDGIAPVTVYNHVGDNAYINNDVSAAVLMALRLFGEPYEATELENLNRRFFNEENIGKSYNFLEIQSYVKEKGYTAHVYPYLTSKDVARFVNQEKNVPVIMAHRLSESQPASVQFTPLGLIIGIDEVAQTYTLHDFYWGYNKTIAIADFENLLARGQRGESFFIAIEPASVNRASVGGELGLPARSPDMEIVEKYVVGLTIARVSINQGDFLTANAIVRELVDDAAFEELVPPYYRIIGYVLAAHSYIFNAPERDLALADELNKKAEAINKDLDRPFGSFWPGFLDMTNPVQGVADGPYTVRGYLHAYRPPVNYDKAIASFEQALAVWPYGQLAREGLAQAKNLKAGRPPR